ncbi:MAG TPA: T9SS type A sorting domain-containing protein [bacterium]|nr:T9SS type A sorting domain-containing protein [bacterium]HPN45038.1 T9SS type A sorting domain-containing protein [bacterium]
MKRRGCLHITVLLLCCLSISVTAQTTVSGYIFWVQDLDPVQSCIITAFDLNNNIIATTATDSAGQFSISFTTDIKELLKPDRYSLPQNYPNPFHQRTFLDLGKMAAAGPLDISVYNILGQLVTQFSLAHLQYELELDLGNSPAGLYFVHLQSPHSSAVLKMLKLESTASFSQKNTPAMSQTSLERNSNYNSRIQLLFSHPQAWTRRDTLNLTDLQNNYFTVLWKTPTIQTQVQEQMNNINLTYTIGGYGYCRAMIVINGTAKDTRYFPLPQAMTYSLPLSSYIPGVLPVELIIYQNPYQKGEQSISFQNTVTISPRCTLVINNNDLYTALRHVNLLLFANQADSMKIGNDVGLTASDWEPFTTQKEWILPAGPGPKIVCMQTKTIQGEITPVAADTILIEPLIPSLHINNDAQYTQTQDVVLSVGQNGSTTNVQQKIAEDLASPNTIWTPFTATLPWRLSPGDGNKVIYLQLMNDFEIESAIIADSILLDTTPPVAAFSVEPDTGLVNETLFTFDPALTFDNICAGQDLQARWDWENDGLYDTFWSPLSSIQRVYTTGGGLKNIKLQVKDQAGWQNTVLMPIYVNTKPVPEFHWQRDSQDSLKVTFNASESFDFEDDAALQFQWDFSGDGAPETGWLNSPVTAFTFPAFASWNTLLAVKDSAGYIQTLERTILNPFRLIMSAITSWVDPLWIQYHYCRTQSIYLAEEIGAGITINKIALHVAEAPAITLHDLTIRIKHTGEDIFSNDNFDNTALQTVFTGNAVLTGPDWYEFVFTAPFKYNGTDNLLVDISFNNPATYNQTAALYSEFRGYRAVHVHGDSPNDTYNKYRTSYVPQIKLYYYSQGE